MLAASGIDMRYTNDKSERLSRVRGAQLIFQWMLLEMENSP